jgi:type II secretory ATPase GspE/PulE/Tfp pilus assembly ATPase PilB-like protein
MQITPRRLIGELMVQSGVITQDQLNIALTEQKRQHRELGKILVSMGFVSEAVMRDFLGKSYQQDSIDLSKIIVDSDVIAMVPKALARRHNLLPIRFDHEDNTLLVAMSDVFNVVAIDAVNAQLGGDIQVHALLAGEAEILNAIDTVYGFDLSLDGILHEIETGEVDYQSIATQEQYSQPLVRLVDALLADAVKRDASDIHFEPEEQFLRIRYRIDGVLQQIRSLHKNYWSAIAVRLKVMSALNIAETRVPQDGRMSMNLSGRTIDFRVAVQPTIFGENIVLRILDSQKGIVPLDKLNLSEDALHTLHLMMARPEGIILVTGPTGSGKTTTLYSLLNHLNTEERNIMTLEDPVEYNLGMVRQTAVNEAVRLDFVNGIRSMLRQDPDIILIGEIRDEPTAEMAFRAAMTGHQVYSTLHTNSAIGAIPRLLDLKIQPDIMADNIIGVIGQRLVRKVCQRCRQATQPNDIERTLLKLPSSQELPDVRIYHAQGCDMCGGRGYKGRLALMEILRMDDTLEKAIAQHENIHTLRQCIYAQGFRTLSDDGIARVLEGVTTLEEVSRVVNLTHHLH